MTRLHRSRRHYHWPRRLFIKIFMWACYNLYVLYLSKQDGAKKPLYFTSYIQTLCLELIGEFRTTVKKSQKEPCPQGLLPGQHFPEIPPEETKSNHICSVYMEKHLQYKRQNPGVSYTDNPHKKVKTNIWCTLCKKYLSVKQGQHAGLPGTQRLNTGAR